MAVTKRTVQLQGLSDVTTYITDSENRYFNITDIPEELSTGRSSFKILGSQFLRENVVLKMELVDFQGRPIYMEPVFNYVEGQGIRVSIEVYDDVPEGTAELTILGELDPTKVDFEIPQQFVNVYNVKFTKIISINKEIINSRPIRFFKRPKVVINEIIKGQITPTASTTGSNNQSIGTVLGVPAVGTEGNTFVTDSAAYDEIPSYTDEQYGFSPFGNYDVQKITSPKYTFTVEGADFSSSMVGGTISITDPQANLGFNPSGEFSTPKYSARISRVINKKTIEVQKPFGIYDSGSNSFKVSALNSSTYNVNWPEPTEFDSSSINFRSFADVQLYDVRTFSGDVYRIAGYVKNNGPFSNWQKVIDTPIESPELLIDPTSITGTTRLGYYSGDDIFTKYWNAFSGDFNSGPTGAGAITLQTYSDDQYLNDSLFISGSVSIDLLDGNEDTGIVLQLKPQYSMSFVEGVAYSISGRAVVNNIGGSSNTAKAVFHLSGSAFGDSNKYDGFGRAIAAVTVENAANKLSRVENPYFEKVFVADSTGTATLHVRFDSGIWELSELSIRPSADTNFSPEFIRLNAVVPPLQKRPDSLDFAFEFYNANNEKSTTVITTLPDHPDGVQFEGENINILGNDNVVGGSLFLGGDTTASGIHFGGIESQLPETGKDGATSSGFIRSVQYQGFTSASANASHTGFMIYSGSVLPNSGDNYSGVGLELVGASGSLRFGTQPSRFEVIADAFFVGNSGSQFISGSGGIIEISSSAFHLSSSGDVVISGSVTATSGDIGNWKIVDGKLSGSNATLDADGSALFMSTKGPDTNPNDGFYIDFTPGGHYVRFGTNFAVSSSGQLIASGAIIEGVLTASEGFIADWTIGSNTIHKPTGGTFTGLSSTGDTRFFAAASSLQNSGSAPFNVKTTGDITGSKVLFTGGKIGGFELTDQVLRNTDNTVELSSILPGLAIKDAGGSNRVLVKSGSLSAVGGATNRIGNNSFELDTINAGRNFVSAVTSWSFTEGGATNISLTDRSGYGNADKAVTGDVTLDVVVPAGSGNYSTANNYKIVHVVTGSFTAGDTLSFSSVARFSSSFGGKGRDRALAPQYFRVEYSGSGTSGQFVPFLPQAQFTASNGYGEYFLGSGQYSSFGASADLPGAADFVRVILSGSVNDDTGFTIEKPLFAGAKGDVDESLKEKKVDVEVKGSTTAEFPETELTFDNFSLKSNTRRVEVTQDGLLIFNSEDSFIKMTGAGIEIRGGSGVANFGTAVNRESFTNDSQVAGTLGAPALQAYASDPNDISTTASPGNVGEFARGNHQHRLQFSTLDTLIGGNTITGLTVASASITGALTASAVSASGTGSFGAILVNGNPVVGATVGGSNTQVQFNDGGSFGGVANFTFNKTTNRLSVAGGVSGSATSTGSFGRIDASNLTGTNTGDVTLAGSRDYITISGQTITRNQIDIGDDTNLAAGTGLILSGDSLSVDFTDSDLRSHISGSYKGDGVFSGSAQITHDDTTGFVANEHIDHSGVDITAGAGLTGGGSITTTRALNVGQGTGITVNATNISTNDSEIVHDNLSGFVANEHIDHSGVTLSAGTGLTGGGDITTNRSFAIDFTDSQFKANVSGSYKGDGVFSGSVQITHDDTTGFVANEHIDHTGVSIVAGAGLTGGGTIASSRTINAVAGTGITVNADNITTNDSEIVHDNLSGFVANEHIDHSGVSIVAGSGLTGGGTIASSRTINVVGGTGITANADNITTNDSEIVHDNLSGFVANEHIDHSAVSITAGAGLTGGGTIASTRTINVVGGTGITANADNITTNDSEIVHDNLSGFVANEHIDHTTVSITAGTGLTGGGDISGTRTLAVDFTDSQFKANVTGSSTALSASLSGRITTEESNVDTLQARNLVAGSGLTGGGTLASDRTFNIGEGTGITVSSDSIATNDSEIVHDNLSGFVANEHIDHSGVEIIAGSGLSGGGTIESSRTINIGAGSGIDVSTNTISVDVSDFMANGSNNRIVTATGTDAMNAESNLTFDGSTLAVSGDVTVTGNVDGRDVSTDGSKLDGIESGATADQSNAEIRAAVEAASDSNVFTDADHSKLNAIEASATADQTITAGSGLTGGGSGDVTLNIGAGTGIDVAADAISVDVSDFMGNGSNNRILTATGADAMTAESNLTFDGSELLVTSAADPILALNKTGGSNAALHFQHAGTAKAYIYSDANGVLKFGNTTTNPVLTLNTDGSIAIASTIDGRDLATDGSKLDGIESGATADQTASEIRTLVGNASDSNVFTDADHTKLDGIETSAKDDQTITAGSGLTGGGTGDVTLNIGAGTGIDVAADAISVDVSDFLSNGVDNRVVTATGTDGFAAEDGLTFDGNDLGVTRKIFHIGDTDTFINFTTDDINIQAGGVNFIDITEDTTNEITFNEEGVVINVRMESNNDANLFFLDGTNDRIGIGKNDPSYKLDVTGTGRFTGNVDFGSGIDVTGNITVTGTVDGVDVAGLEGRSIIAGDGLTGGGTLAASRTLNIGAGTGIDVAADAISVDVSDFMANGSNNRILTATGADAMNAESGLTYDGSTIAISGKMNATVDTNGGHVNRFTNNNTGTSAYTEVIIESGTSGRELRIGASHNYSSTEWNNTWIYSVGRDLKIATDSGYDIDFYAGGLTTSDIKMSILSGGNVGIGTTSPSQKLHVVGDAFIDGNLTAREIYTDIVSSSIKYTSGSNKLGDSMDDVHDVTGSLRVTGSTFLENAEIGAWPPSTGYMMIGHKNLDHTATGNYALIQNGSGQTLLNASSGQNLYLRINNADKLVFNGSAATFSTTTNFSSLASTNMNIDSGDIASGVTINKSPVVNFNSGDVQGSLTLSNLASGTGTLTIQATSVEGSMLNDNVISGQGAMTGDVADADELMISDAGVLKRADFSVVRDAVFNDVSGDITIAAGGAATIAANSVALGTDTTGNYVSSLVAGTGIDLANNSGESATPTVSVDVSDFMSNGSNNRILTAAGADTMNAEENLTFDGSTLAIADGRSFSTSTFISGILGDGFRIDDSNNNSGSSLEIDNIVVRNTLRTHIFQKDVVKATNGILLVSDSGVISGSTGTTSTGTITVENDKSATFTSGQKAIFKEAGDDGSINFVQFTFTSNGTTSGVQSGFTKYNITANNGTLANLEPGGTFARISGGSVLIDASSPNSPFIDINYASGSTTARFGNLAGITSPRFGALGSNFGFWASGSAFLEGTINAKAGNIGTWGIGETAISSSGNNVIIDAATKRITINDGSNDRVHLGEVGSAYGLKIFDGTGTADGDRLVELGSGDNMIAGWDLKTDKIGKGPVSMSFADESFIVNAVNKNKVRMGNLNGKFGISSDQYGFILGDGSNDNSAGNVMVELSDRQNIIAGWELTPGTIQTNSTAGSVAISSTSQSFSIYTASIDYDRPKLVLGKLPLDDGTTDSPYGLAVFSGSQGEVTSGSLANASVVITKNIAKLAGWELVPGRLTSGTVAKIDGNNASIALGTNATTHTSATPQPNLFFVSASTNPVFFVGENFSFINNELKAAGWTIGSTSISKSTDVVIDSNAKSITLGNGAVAIENNSGTPIIRSATNFTSGNGFFLSSAGTNNFRVGNAGAARLQFTGTNVEIYNSSNTKLVSLGASNTIASWTINSSTITGGSVTIDSAGIIRSATDFANGDGFFLSSASTNNFRVGDAGAARLQFTGTNTEIYNSSNQKLVSLGASNTIAGWTITTGAISKNDVKLDSTTNGEGLYVKKSGFGDNSTAGAFIGLDSGTAKFNVSNADDSKFIKFDGNNFTVDAGNFSLDSSGNVTATNASLTGTVTATAGQIGGFGIAAGAISSSNNNLALSSTHASMSLGNKVKIAGGTDSYIAGGGHFTGDPFQSFDNDVLGFVLGMESSAVKFEVNDGTGDNFILFDSSAGTPLDIRAESFQLGSTDFRLTNTSLKLGTIDGVTDTASSETGMFVDSSGNILLKAGTSSETGYIQFNGNNLKIKTSNFTVDGGDVTLSGTITADAGQIGGFNISNNSISSSNDALILKSSGAITGSKAKFSGGEIGGWTVSSDRLTSPAGTVVLDSAGSIRVGGVVNASTTATTNAGFFADNSGNVLIKANDNNNNFIKFDADATNPMEIKTNAFHLDTSGDVTMTGDITATNITATNTGNLGGWQLSAAGLSKEQSGKVFSKYTSSFVNNNDEPRLQLDRIFQLPPPLMLDGGGERTQLIFKNADDAGAMTMSFKGALPNISTANTPSSYLSNSDIGKRGSIEMYVGSSQRSSSAAYNSGNGRDPGGGVNAFKSFFGGASLGVRVNYRDKLGSTDYDVNDYMGMTATVGAHNDNGLKGRGAFFYASKYSGSWMYMGSGSIPTEMADFTIPHDRHPGGLSGDYNYGLTLWSGSFFHMTGSRDNPPTASIHGQMTIAGGNYGLGRRGTVNSNVHSTAMSYDGVQFGNASTLNIVGQNSNGMHEAYVTFIKPGTAGIGIHTLAHVTGSNTKLVMRTQNFGPPLRDLMTWDASTARVGILDTSPSYTLDVGGTINATELRVNGSVISAGGLGNLSEDTTPQLGGDLDLNGDDITGTGNINITGGITSTGDFTVDTDVIFADVSADRVSITGTGTKTTNKTLQVNINNSSTVAHSGNALAGGSGGDGILIYNSNATSGVYANLDFRANNADGRIAYKYMGSANTGDFIFSTDNAGTVAERLRLTAAGDLHLNESVLFDSSLRQVAAKTRMVLVFGRNSTISTTSTTTFEGYAANGASNGEGYRMVRAGEVTGVSVQYDVNSSGGSGSSCKVQVTKNGSDISGANATHTFVAGGSGVHTTFAAGTYTFVAGDAIGVDLVLTRISSGTVSLDDCTMIVEISC